VNFRGADSTARISSNAEQHLTACLIADATNTTELQKNAYDSS
jgi:hypothetical protein